jgi:hypothetical protein
MLVAHGGTASPALIQPRVEPEIGLRFDHSLPGDANLDDVLGAVGEAFACLEIVDSVYPDYRFRLEDNTADGSSAAQVVVGPVLTSIEHLDDISVTVSPVANAGSFVSGRTQAFEYAASAIRKLNAAGIDAEVVALAQDLAQWYDEGIANSRQAESLLQSSDIASRQGTPGKSWQTTERHHRDRCLEINQHGAQLQQSLSRKYGVTFPSLQ